MEVVGGILSMRWHADHVRGAIRQHTGSSISHPVQMMTSFAKTQRSAQPFYRLTSMEAKIRYSAIKSLSDLSRESHVERDEDRCRN